LNFYLDRDFGAYSRYNAEERLKLMCALHHVVGAHFPDRYEVCIKGLIMIIKVLIEQDIKFAEDIPG
jgi:hypothetical protein